MTEECVLKLVDDKANIMNFKNNYEHNMELTEDEVKKIFLFNIKANNNSIRYYLLQHCTLFIFNADG